MRREEDAWAPDGVPPVSAPSEAVSRRRLRTAAIVVVAIVIAGVATAVLRGFGVIGAEAGDVEAVPGKGKRQTVVRAAPANVGSIVVRLIYPGEIIADAAEIAARIAGRLEEVRVRIGDRVRRGDLLARVDAAHLVLERRAALAGVRLAQARLKRASADLAVGRRELERTEPLAAKKLVSDHEFEKLRSGVESLEAEAEVARSEVDQGRAQAALAARLIQDARLVAPFSGVIAERYLDPGAFVQAGTPVLRLVADSGLSVRFRAPERDLADLRPGREISVVTQATGESVFAGRVTRVSGEIERTDRSVVVEGLIDEPGDLLRPGMYATVRMDARTIENALLVPAAAVISRTDDSGEEARAVFVLEKGVARQKSVRVLGRDGDVVAIEGPLSAGDEVLTLGHESLADGDPVSVATPAGSGPAAAGRGDRGGK